MGDRGILQRDLDHILLCVLDTLTDGFRYLGCFAETVAHVTVLVSDDHERRKTLDTTALDGLGHTVHYDELFLEVQLGGIKILNHCFTPMICLTLD